MLRKWQTVLEYWVNTELGKIYIHARNTGALPLHTWRNCIGRINRNNWKLGFMWITGLQVFLFHHWSPPGLRSFSPFHWFKNGSCQFLAKECAQVLVNCLEDEDWSGKLTGLTDWLRFYNPVNPLRSCNWNHTFPGQAWSSKRLTSICAHSFARNSQLLPDPAGIKPMIASLMHIRLSHWGWPDQLDMALMGWLGCKTSMKIKALQALHHAPPLHLHQASAITEMCSTCYVPLHFCKASRKSLKPFSSYRKSTRLWLGSLLTMFKGGNSKSR